MKRKLLSPPLTTLFIQGLFDKRIKDATTTIGTRSNQMLTIRKNILLGMGVILISLISIAYYQYNKPAPAIADVTGESVSASSLLTAFSRNEVEANKQYLNQVLQVSGNVIEIKSGSNSSVQVLLDANDPMSTIACTMEDSKQEVKAGQPILLKVSTGYLNDVVLIKRILVPQQK